VKSAEHYFNNYYYQSLPHDAQMLYRKKLIVRYFTESICDQLLLDSKKFQYCYYKGVWWLVSWRLLSLPLA